MNRFSRIARVALPAVATSAALIAGGAAASAPTTSGAGSDAGAAKATTFSMVRSTGAVNAGCLKGAGADVTVKELGDVEKMTVSAHGLPPATAFVLFITQTPDAPFGVAWYQSDLVSDQSGNARVTVEGRFNNETFALATGAAEAPATHAGDAVSNPPFAPTHIYHVGVWFDSVEGAVAAGCPNTVTPFNGDHTAGIQALSTRNFPALAGPLGKIG